MIVLDTHAWIWWASHPKKLGTAGRRALEGASRIGIPAICCWEVAMLVEKERLRLDRPVLAWLRLALGLPLVELLALTPEVAVSAATLSDGFHGDPADRLIVASALAHRAPLMTKDRRIRDWDRVVTLW